MAKLGNEIKLVLQEGQRAWHYQLVDPIIKFASN